MDLFQRDAQNFIRNVVQIQRQENFHPPQRRQSLHTEQVQQRLIHPSRVLPPQLLVQNPNVSVVPPSPVSSQSRSCCNGMERHCHPSSTVSFQSSTNQRNNIHMPQTFSSMPTASQPVEIWQGQNHDPSLLYNNFQFEHQQTNTIPHHHNGPPNSYTPPRRMPIPSASKPSQRVAGTQKSPLEAARQRQVLVMSKTLQGLTVELNDKNAEVRKLQIEIEKYEQQANEKAYIEQCYDHLKQENAKLLKGNKSLEEQAQTATTNVAAMFKQKEDITQEMVDLKCLHRIEMDNMLGTKSHFLWQAVKKDEKIKFLKKEVEALAYEKSSLASKYDKAKETHAVEISTFKDIVQTLQLSKVADIEVLEKDKINLQKTLSKTQEELTSKLHEAEEKSLAAIEQKGMEINYLTRKIEKLERNKNKLLKTAEDDKKAYEELELENQTIQEKMTSLQEAMNEAKKKIDAVISENTIRGIDFQANTWELEAKQKKVEQLTESLTLEKALMIKMKKELELQICVKDEKIKEGETKLLGKGQEITALKIQLEEMLKESVKEKVKLQKINKELKLQRDKSLEESQILTKANTDLENALEKEREKGGNYRKEITQLILKDKETVDQLKNTHEQIKLMEEKLRSKNVMMKSTLQEHEKAMTALKLKHGLIVKVLDDGRQKLKSENVIMKSTLQEHEKAMAAMKEYHALIVKALDDEKHKLKEQADIELAKMKEEEKRDHVEKVESLKITHEQEIQRVTAEFKMKLDNQAQQDLTSAQELAFQGQLGQDASLKATDCLQNVCTKENVQIQPCSSRQVSPCNNLIRIIHTAQENCQAEKVKTSSPSKRPIKVALIQKWQNGFVVATTAISNPSKRKLSKPEISWEEIKKQKSRNEGRAKKRAEHTEVCDLVDLTSDYEDDDEDPCASTSINDIFDDGMEPELKQTSSIDMEEVG